MSQKVRDWLRQLRLLDQTTHEDRVEIDSEIERQTGVHCDYAIEKKMITEREFRRVVERVLAQKKMAMKKTLDKLVEQKAVV
ncbi:hypothetical protein E3J74_01900 [Candidatus Bathyarchaeota archaeon]|nr:MAG: hypothetical protein E3J74_01900 [Candidatus Bathyarchaeota archaeon]